MEDFIGKYNGNQIDSRLDKVKDMVGATASEAGAAGLVPTPAAGDENRFLCGDGIWKNVVVKNDDEEAAITVLVELLNNVDHSIHTCTQQQYDTLKALFKDVTENTGVLLKPTLDFIKYTSGGLPSYVLVMYDYEGESSIQVFVGVSMEVLMSGKISVGLFVGSDLSLHNIIVSTVISSSNEGGISISQGYVSSADSVSISKDINFSLNGEGNKALMDDGTYKSISNEVDITDMIIDDTGQYKTIITSDDFNNLKQYVLDRKDLYIDIHAVYDEIILNSSKVRFISNVIVGDDILLTFISIDTSGGYSPSVSIIEIDGSNLTIKISISNI